MGPLPPDIVEKVDKLYSSWDHITSDFNTLNSRITNIDEKNTSDDIQKIVNRIIDSKLKEGGGILKKDELKKDDEFKKIINEIIAEYKKEEPTKEEPIKDESKKDRTSNKIHSDFKKAFISMLKKDENFRKEIIKEIVDLQNANNLKKETTKQSTVNDSTKQ